MKKLILSLLIWMPLILLGQATKKINSKDDSEVYYVLKSDKSVKHGNYKKMYKNGSVKVNGYYQKGVKDSIWEFFDYKGELAQKFDYSKNDVVYYKMSVWDNDGKFMLNGSDTTKVLLDRPPLYIGGSVMMVEPILENMRYPAKARENGISGIVYISFIIDKNGQASNHGIKSGIGYGCDEEALKVVKNVPNAWLPGMLHGQPVEVVYNFPIRFSLK